MSEMSDMQKLIMALKLAKRERVGLGLTYFDVIELMGELESLKDYIAELEEKQRWRVVADGELPEVYRDEDGDFIPFLVCEGDGGHPFIAMYNGINWWAGIFVPDITHWMPLPESPNDTQTQTIVYGREEVQGCAK